MPQTQNPQSAEGESGVCTSGASAISVQVYGLPLMRDRMKAWQEVVAVSPVTAVGHDPRWLAAICEGLQYRPYILFAENQANQTIGVLPLAYVNSFLFGRFLVGLPYINSSGIVTSDAHAAAALVDRAVKLAQELNVRYLELRHETCVPHPALGTTLDTKVHMRFRLSDKMEQLWMDIKSKARNQVRKGQKQGFTVHWGRNDLLKDFYNVFSHNMRDLGTPVYSCQLFESILGQFGEEAEICVIRSENRAVAGALLVHGSGVTEVQSASSLREFNPRNANDLLYWHLLTRAVERGQHTFDFGRSTFDSPTYRFKKKWGASPVPATWQYHVRKGNVRDMRLESGKYQLAVKMWQYLPVSLARIIGPRIIRGIP